MKYLLLSCAMENNLVGRIVVRASMSLIDNEQQRMRTDALIQ